MKVWYGTRARLARSVPFLFPCRPSSSGKQCRILFLVDPSGCAAQRRRWSCARFLQLRFVLFRFDVRIAGLPRYWLKIPYLVTQYGWAA